MAITLRGLLDVRCRDGWQQRCLMGSLLSSDLHLAFLSDSWPWGSPPDGWLQNDRTAAAQRPRPSFPLQSFWCLDMPALSDRRLGDCWSSSIPSRPLRPSLSFSHNYIRSDSYNKALFHDLVVALLPWPNLTDTSRRIRSKCEVFSKGISFFQSLLLLTLL